MPEPRQLVKIFLASPGDLAVERRAVKELDTELNLVLADSLGFRVEIYGWEETISATGRPQAVINRELAKCELFIGMMSRRWGTQPSIKGPYTSGFEEEYELSRESHKLTGKPEMAMYFKNIPPDIEKDPGEELKKVLAFKSKVYSEKSILCEAFEDFHSLKDKVRLKIQDYLISLNKAAEEIIEEGQAKPKSDAKQVNNTEEKAALKSSLSEEGVQFAKEFLDKTKEARALDNITSFDVARFRLLSSIISYAGNDEPFLGVHDANLIYTQKNLSYGFQEVRKLIDFGLKYLEDENVPLWSWIATVDKKSEASYLLFRSVSYTDVAIGRGAINALRLIGLSISDANMAKEASRGHYIESWLADKSPDAIKVAGLNYLRDYGQGSELALIQTELEKANSKSSRAALEALICIQLRYDESAALKIAFENQFELLDDTVMEKLLSCTGVIDNETLLLGLTHKNSRIRLESFTRIKAEKKITPSQLEEFKNDSYIKIRQSVVEYLVAEGEKASDEAVKNILVKPQKQLGLINYFNKTSWQRDDVGEAYFENYLFLNYSKLTKSALNRTVKEAPIFDYIPYLALCNRFFGSQSDDLKKNIDDKYKSRFDDYINGLKEKGVGKEEIKELREIEGFCRRKLTRKSLDLLCKKGNEKDLALIRKNIRSEYIKSSTPEIQYFQRYGKWEDIAYLVKAKDYYSNEVSLIRSFEEDKPFHRSIAEAIHHIGKHRIDELINIEMPNSVLIHLLKLCSISNFSKTSNKTISSFLDHKDEEIRKRFTMKCIQTLGKHQLQSLLDEYMTKNDRRFYNVIYWLDFGSSMPKPTTEKAIRNQWDQSN